MSVQFQEFVVDDNGQPLVMADDKLLCHIITETGQPDTVPLEREMLIAAGILHVENQNQKMASEDQETANSGFCGAEWSTEETRFLLDKYHEYLPKVGPLKTFRHKKAMWEQISKKLQEELGITKNADQCLNRYKTIMKRKRTSSNINGTSGEKRVKIYFEDEINKIASIDDSLQPEVLMGVDKFVVNEIPLSVKKQKTGGSLHDLLLKMHKEKEEARKQRHDEKMDFLRGLAALLDKN